MVRGHARSWKGIFHYVERSHEIAFMLVREREGQTRGKKKEKYKREVAKFMPQFVR